MEKVSKKGELPPLSSPLWGEDKGEGEEYPVCLTQTPLYKRGMYHHIESNKSSPRI